MPSPAVTFEGAQGTGHGSFPPRANTGGDGTFNINGVPVHRDGDPWGEHCSGNNCHTSSLNGGSATFFVNGMGAGRIGDPVACGSAVAEGDPTFRVAG